jgi:hypothetical protein
VHPFHRLEIMVTRQQCYKLTDVASKFPLVGPGLAKNAGKIAIQVGTGIVAGIIVGAIGCTIM